MTQIIDKNNNENTKNDQIEDSREDLKVGNIGIAWKIQLSQKNANKNQSSEKFHQRILPRYLAFAFEAFASLPKETSDGEKLPP
jgi:hypothetical protein